MAAEPVPKSLEFRLVFRWVLLASARGAPSDIFGSAASVPELNALPHIYIYICMYIYIYVYIHMTFFVDASCLLLLPGAYGQ